MIRSNDMAIYQEPRIKTNICQGRCMTTACPHSFEKWVALACKEPGKTKLSSEQVSIASLMVARSFAGIASPFSMHCFNRFDPRAPIKVRMAMIERSCCFTAKPFENPLVCFSMSNFASTSSWQGYSGRTLQHTKARYEFRLRLLTVTR